MALGAAVLAFVAVALLVNHAVPAFFDRPDPVPEEVVGKQVGLTRYRLGQALEDGTLTDQEIARAAGEEWRAERDHTPPRVVVKYPVPGEDKSYQCHAFTFPGGLKAGALVTTQKLNECPI
ncbi:hypothetical protein AQF52_3471 [Streptomyces venezuelae]|uniref:hypothetical protein n=1 Tax=Streptomyces gardneri TaxID=66892 RepID=UPI0006BD03C8|nr:hypothetical protein [Streptomyces gardneri]ALO09065.1 hypothetical protein AQF52_3471 [Streptomyces venezuelae]QPK46210.1 hypothetical protein H4W23_17280 [Streptomyces gardneri]WRK37581.1 hypothetical protein U0M97_17365 [Streptomyces venezuelae]CUM40538.1 hypothetical protein BN2537_10041 [Streptomyces venezuelae]